MEKVQTINAAAARAGHYRWAIVGLLFTATVINYVDRQMIGVLKAPISEDMGWSEGDFANVIFWFQMAYAVGYLGFGKVVDLIGARLGYAIAFIIWQLAHIAHGGAYSVTQFAMARFGLGIGESGNFPAGIKAVTEWFPAKERALAIGLFNAGSNIGAILTPLLIPLIVVAWGWRSAFVITGLLAFIWLAFWLVMYRSPREHKKVTDGELAWIEQDPADPAVHIGYGAVLSRRETWAFSLGKFFIDPIWWFFLFWLPGYLLERYDLNLLTFGLPLAAIYLISDAGSVAGGWMSSRLMKGGRSANFARKITMFTCACAVLPIFFAQSIDSVWLAVLVIGLATAGHQAFSANLLALPSDTFPRGAVGSVIGIGGTAGAVGGMLMTMATGWILEADPENYTILFAIAACAYFLALVAVHLLSPRLEKAQF